MAIDHTGGVFSYLPHHLDLALEDSVGHSTCRAIMGLGLGYHGVDGGFLACCHGRWVLGGGVSMVICPTGVGIPLYSHTGGANNHTYPTAKNPPTTP